MIAAAPGPGDYPVHTQMPAAPSSPADYQSMWDPFVVRLGNGARPIEVTPEAISESRLMAPFDSLPWNGRQIARDKDANWYVLVEQGTGSGSLFLAFGPGPISAPDRPRGGDLPAFALVGSGPDAVFQAAGGASRGSIVIDVAQQLHVVFHQSDGLWHLQTRLDDKSPANLRNRAAWTGPAQLVKGPCRAGDLMRDASRGVAICYSQDDKVFYRALTAATPETVAGPVSGLPALRRFAAPPNEPEDDAAAPGLGKLRHPDAAVPGRASLKLPYSECESQDAVMDLAPDGTVWLAFRRDFALWTTQRSPTGKWSPPERVVREYAFHPSLVIVGGQPLIVYHHDGLRRLPLDLGGDLTKRAGGAPALGYAARTDEGWLVGTLAAPEEITVFRRGMWAKRGAGQQIPQIEQLGWPALFRDPQGVAWAMWQNTTRRWSYCARWQGEGFGDIQECRGPFNAPRLPVNAEKLPPAHAPDVGLLFYAAAAGGPNRVIFDRLRVPALATTDDREVLFLDGLEIAEARGVDWKLNPMTKPIAEPAFSPLKGERTALNAAVTKRGDLYAMTYSRSFEGGGGVQGFAISRDGLRFQPVEALPTDLPAPSRGPARPLNFWNGIESSRVKPFYPHPAPAAANHKFVRLAFTTDARGSYWLEHSPDGRQWTRGPQLTAPEAMREQGQPNLYEAHDPARPLRIYSRVYTETGRSWGVIWSSDLEHWSGLEHLLDPDEPYARVPATERIGNTGKAYTMRGQIFLDAVAGKGEDEIYAASVRKAEGLYFCFYWPGRQGRPLSDIGIAVSRDGFNFSRVKNGQRSLPLGPPGAWDCGYIFQMNPLLEPGNDQVRVYYRATAARREGTDEFEHYLTEVGVATIRVNGFTYYTPRDSNTTGSVTTIPIESPAGMKRGLAVNFATGPGKGGALAVEVLDAATGKPLKDYALADRRVLAASGLAVPVAWRRTEALPAGRQIRLRFHLAGSGTRLYSFGFRDL